MPIVAQTPNANDAAPPFVGGLTLTLRNEKNEAELRALTNVTGSARFTTVPPGRWRTKFDAGILPSPSAPKSP